MFNKIKYLYALIENTKLTPTTTATALKVTLADLESRLVELADILAEITAVHDPWQYDHTTYCEFCDRSYSEGHAATCAWLRLVELTIGL